jgi:hypothetical protein
MRAKQTIMEKLTALVGSRYGAMLLVLLTHLALVSFLDERRVIRWFLDASFIALLGSALHAIPGRRTLRVFVIFVGLCAAVLGVAYRELNVDVALPIGTLVRASFCVSVIVIIFKDVLHRHEVDMDAVFGACCVYLLMGLAWESVYAWVDWQVPGSFTLPVGVSEAGASQGIAAGQSDLLYFSLITMTTIGYGDIVPKSPPARIFAALEGLVAQLYVAIIIARMVGMELAHRRSDASPEQ